MRAGGYDFRFSATNGMLDGVVSEHEVPPKWARAVMMILLLHPADSESILAT